MAKLVPKTHEQLISLLEDHLFLLAESLHGLNGGDAAYIRELAAKLRALVCTSAGLDGLLWRVCEAVRVDDAVRIRYPGNLDTSHPLARGLTFWFAPVASDGSGDERVPLQTWPLREHIKKHEAIFVEGQSLTHEFMIKELADRSGIAHEADGVSKVLAQINGQVMGDVPPYFSMLDSDARLALQVGERAIQAAVVSGYKRRRAAAAPPPLKPLHSTQFNQKLDLPKAENRPQHEGSVVFAIDVHRAEQEQRPLRFPPMESSGVVLNVEITRRGRLAIAVDGLLFPFGCECAMPADDGKPMYIAITWKGTDVRAYAAGEQVGGMRVQRQGGEA